MSHFCFSNERMSRATFEKGLGRTLDFKTKSIMAWRQVAAKKTTGRSTLF
jgi:hypothetical protein